MRFRPLLEPLEDRSLPATLTVTATGDTIAVDGLVTLREAITSANNNANVNADVVGIGGYGTDTIAFNIGGGGLRTITPTSPLPTITDPLIIDGFTQPGAAPNTSPITEASNAVLLIELNGLNAGGGSGLTITAGASTVRGLVINRFPSEGIDIAGGGGNLIRGNYIGTNPAGTVILGNGHAGVFITDSSNNRIGGRHPAARNLLSGNAGGIAILDAGGGATDNMIRGNFVGTTASGLAPLGNTGDGISLAGASRTRIGGAAEGTGNLVSGNGGVGIALIGGDSSTIQGNRIGTDRTGMSSLGGGIHQHGIISNSSSNNYIGGTTFAARNVIAGNGGIGLVVNGNANAVQGNLIGVAADGTSALGNGRDGVAVHFASTGNTIGGPAAGNVIAFNGGDGVTFQFANGTGNAVLANAIFSNGHLGIDLSDDAVTANDVGDGDVGPNNRQNFPVLTSAVTTGGATTVAGTLNSTPFGTFHIELFANAAADPSGFGEGQVLLGSVTVTDSDGDGHTAFSFNSSSPVGPGQFITATATDVSGNTSEFSAALANASEDTPTDVRIRKRTTVSMVQPGEEITFMMVVRNIGASPAFGLSMRDVVPTGTTFVSFAAPVGWTVQTPPPGGRGTVTATRSMLESGGVAAFEMVVTVNRKHAPQTVINTAEVATVNPDTDLANNSDSVVVQVTAPDGEKREHDKP